jgi:hypothetical protein
LGNRVEGMAPHLEATDPVWRERDATVRPKNPTLEEIDKFFTFKKLQSQAMSFEQQYKKAFLTGGEEGRRFARDQPPKKREIRSLIERRMKELHLTPITDRTWQRVWQDPFIAALLRCP